MSSRMVNIVVFSLLTISSYAFELHQNESSHNYSDIKEVKPNNTFDTANNVGLLIDRDMIQGNTESSDDLDYYSFQVSEGEKFAITLTNIDCSAPHFLDSGLS